MAICGGVSSIITPETFIPLCRARMMSAIGQCQTFCDTADGYARGEGCGIVILKKLSQVCTSILDQNDEVTLALEKVQVGKDQEKRLPLQKPRWEKKPN